MQGIQSDRLLFGVPKKGRLYEKVCQLLKGAGIAYNRPNRLDIADCTTLPLTLVFLPAHDIAQYVADGNVHLGITGQDIIRETGASKLKTVLPLGFGKCRLCVQAPIGKYTSPEELVGKRIVTSFPTISKEYFGELKSNKRQKTEGKTSSGTPIHYVTGSVEVACSLGLADAVVDLVETGTTMRAAGLEIVSTILTSETVLISKENIENAEFEKLVKKIAQRIEGYQIATKHVMVTYNILAKDLVKASLITPGRESPTVTPLHNTDWVSVSAIIETLNAATVLDELSEIGARSILVMELANSRFPLTSTLEV